MYPESVRCLTVSELTSLGSNNKLQTHVSDFAIISGARCSNMEDYKNHVSPYFILSDDFEIPGIVTEDSILSTEAPSKKDIAIRPCIRFSDVKDQATIYDSAASDKITVSYGEYPQRISGGIEEAALNTLYNLGYYEKTGKKYTIYQDDKLVEFDEYYIGKEKFILYQVPMDNKKRIINNNGELLENGKSYWVRVQKIRWILDPEKDLLVSNDCLISGINYGTSSDKYVNSRLNNFIVNNFAKEIVPSTLGQVISK